jgi:hypothetical protein
VPVIAGAMILAGALSIVLLGRRRSSDGKASVQTLVTPAPPASEATARRLTPGLGDVSRADASDLYPKAKQRALAWNSDARLVSITASPVIADKVDLTQEDAEIVYLFAPSPAGRGAIYGHLTVTMRQTGIEQSASTETSKPGPAKARAPAATPIDVVEPNCVFDAAAKAAHASGIPPRTEMKLRYESDGARRGVWTARVPGHGELDRVIDGQTCTILTRR